MSGRQVLHLLMQGAQQQMQNARLVEFGHIASFDPVSIAVKVILPTVQDNGGNPILTGWMPLGSFWVGNGFGAIFHPHGGATFENPELGEAVIVVVIEQDSGISAAAHLIFNNMMKSPNAAAAQNNLPLITEPGDFLLMHESGSLLHFNHLGDVHLVTQHDLIAKVGHDLTATIAHDLSATVTGKVSIGATEIDLSHGGTLQKLLNDHAKGTYNSHTHTDPQGGVTGTPSQQMGDSDETSILKAE